MPVDTSQVAAHRPLRFANVDEALAEVDRIAAAHAAGALRTVGNWSAGQNLAHVAAWINYAYTGFPMPQAPFFVRWYLRWVLPRYLKRGMPRGVAIPGVPGGTTGAEELPVPEAAERLRVALRRLASDEAAPHPSPAFGQLSHADRIALNLRHAELHLGYLSY